MKFIHPDIILRLLTKAEGSENSLKLFKRVEAGSEVVLTNEAAVIEVINILASNGFGLSPEEIRGKLTPILTLEGLRLRHKRRIMLALDIWAKHKELDFIDVLVIAYMERDDTKEIYSFNKKLDNLPQIKRIEP